MDSINSKFDTIMREMKQMREETREEIRGIIMAFPTVQKFMEWRDSRKPSITLEDVKRLIEESKSGVQSA